LLDAYAAAREDAADETGLPLELFPERCPYSPDEVEAASWWPGEGRR
jgi:hypothetical protein